MKNPLQRNLNLWVIEKSFHSQEKKKQSKSHVGKHWNWNRWKKISKKFILGNSIVFNNFNVVKIVFY